MDNEAATFEALQLRLEVDEYGTKRYYNHKNQLHKIHGPAVEWADGDKEWYLDGLVHREDGPAIEYVSGSKFWYLNGKLHRTDGPAIEWSIGDKEWCLNNTRFTKKEFLSHPLCTIK